jgi:hypothetical protein
MKKLFVYLFLVTVLFGCGSSNSENSSSESSISTSESSEDTSDPCDDMLSYNRGVSTGRANKNYYADCDYFWELDNDGNMSKSCYCMGYETIEKEL